MEDRLRRAEQEKSELAGALQTLCRQIPQKTRRGRSPSSSGSASPPHNRRKESIEPIRGRSRTRRSVLDRLGRPSVLSWLGRRGNKPERQERDAHHGQHHSRERERRSQRRELTPQSERRSGDRPVGAEEIRDIMEDILDRRQGKDGHEQLTARQLVQRVTRTPFVRAINTAPKPRHFQEPTFKLYDARSDPLDHLSYYMQRMSYWAEDDAALCRSFASSLGDKARCWYRKLPEGKIRDFRELSELFVERFRTSRPGPKVMDHLYALYRKDDESLRNYANRFWDLYEEVKADEASKVDTFKNGLGRDSSLYESLVLHPPTTVQALAERVEKYIVLEEFRSRPRADEIDKKGSKNRADKDSGRAQDSRGQRRGRDRDSRWEKNKDRRRSDSRDRKGNGRPNRRNNEKPVDQTLE